MLWFLVWTSLVLGTCVGAFFLLRDLWRRAKALLAELDRGAQLADRMEIRSRELDEQARAKRESRDAAAGPDAAAARATLSRLADARRDRRAVRATRHEATFAAWRAYTR